MPLPLVEVLLWVKSLVDSVSRSFPHYPILGVHVLVQFRELAGGIRAPRPGFVFPIDLDNEARSGLPQVCHETLA